MPDKSIVGHVPHIRVENETSSDGGEKFSRTKSCRSLTPHRKRRNTVRDDIHMQGKGWGRGENGGSPSPAALVSLWIASEKVLPEEGQTLILCHNGVTDCGLYLALSFLLERMAVENECDVISAVRAVRRVGPIRNSSNPRYGMQSRSFANVHVFVFHNGIMV